MNEEDKAPRHGNLHERHPDLCGVRTEKMTLTHPTEHSSNLQDKVELPPSRDLTCSCRSLECLGSQLREQKRKTWVIKVRFPNLQVLHF